MAGLIACSDSADAVRAAAWRVEQDDWLAHPGSVGGDDSSAQVPASPADRLQADLGVLDRGEAELSQCLALHDESAGPPGPAQDCPREQIVNFEAGRDGVVEREVPIWRNPMSSAFFYESGMTIDADGAPNAYHPDNIGLDDLANAGEPGYWPGLAKDENRIPFIQGPDDPFPGYYVSATALADRTKPVRDPSRYVDASKIPYIVLPGGMARWLGSSPGDFAAVFNLRNGRSSPAIFADVGPADHIGEGSIALAENLAIRSDARNGGARRGILYLVFPGSGNRKPRTVEEIYGETERLLQAWGGIRQLAACMAP